MRKREEPVRTYVRHRERSEWGTGLLVHEGQVESTFVFADGARRVFKAAQRAQFLEPAPAPADDVRERLERGFASGGASTPKAMHLDFVAQIRANRRDAGVYLAYADWLQTQKDPRGELIVVQHQLMTKPRDQKLHAAQRALFERHGTYFMPKPLADILDGNSGCTVVWRYGFLTHVRLARRPRDTFDPAHVIPDLLTHPSAEFLESLAFGPVGVRDNPHYIPCLEAVAQTGHPLLEELSTDPSNGPRSRLGNIVPLFSALPSLQRLVLGGHAARVASQTRHDQLRSITIEVETALAMSPLLRSKFPQLESLEIDMPAFKIAPADIYQMLDGRRMPNLRRLVLRRTQKTKAILDAIVKSAHLGKLEELVLADGDLPAKTMELAQLRENLLAHLRVLQVEGHAVEDPLEHRREEARAIVANRADAARREWTTLARDAEIVWGERDGHAVFVRLGTTHTGCSCEAPKPCPHIHVLRVIANAWQTLDEREVPDDFMQRLRR